jgi:monoamine oxidase
VALTRRTFLGGSVAALAMACSSARPPASHAPVPDPDGFVVTRWRADPFAVGSYSYLAVGSTPDDRRALAAPVDDRLFFAGEATSVAHPATVHGAVTSGERAAAEVLAVAARESSVLVIGAGAAGLAAATALQDQGLAVTVVEGRERTGGRIWTDESLGTAVDLGASWIHGVDANPVAVLAGELGLVTVPTDYDDHEAYFDDGSPLTDTQWARAEAVVAADPLAPPPDPLSRWYANVLIEHEYAGPLHDLAPAFDEGEPDLGPDVLFPDGYGALVQAVAEDLDVRLGQVVRAVDQSRDGVVVTTEDAEHAADHAVVTLPLGVLKAGRVAFRPALPAAKRAAVTRLGMGLLDKVALRFPDVFWDQTTDFISWIDPEARGRWGAFLNLWPVTGAPILVGFNAADYAEELEARPDESVVEEAMTVLRRIYGR